MERDGGGELSFAILKEKPLPFSLSGARVRISIIWASGSIQAGNGEEEVKSGRK